jgi:hypothetical protein
MNKTTQSSYNWYQMKLRLLREENNRLREVITGLQLELDDAIEKT